MAVPFFLKSNFLPGPSTGLTVIHINAEEAQETKRIILAQRACVAPMPIAPPFLWFSISLSLLYLLFLSSLCMLWSHQDKGYVWVDFLCSKASGIIRESSHRRPALFTKTSDSATDPISCRFLSKVPWYKANQWIQKETSAANFLGRGTAHVRSTWRLCFRNGQRYGLNGVPHKIHTLES